MRESPTAFIGRKLERELANTDSFLRDVAEEVRRDRLYAQFKRYGWIGAVVVVLIVGGAAAREWLVSKEIAAAQDLGDSILEALEAGDPSASAQSLGSLQAETDEARALVHMIAAVKHLEAGQAGEAASMLRRTASDPSLPPHYRDIALLKALAIESDSVGPDSVISEVEPLADPGRPFRVLALETKALALLEKGQVQEAVDIMSSLVVDSESTDSQRRRVRAVLNALGIEPGSELAN